MKYSKEFIEQVRNKSSLYNLIANDTQLKKDGNVWKGRCPFARTRHSNGLDSDPSFVLYPAGQKASYESFYCFGCHIGDKKQSGYGSDIFEYLRLKNGVMFDEAVKIAADIAGIKLEENEEQEEIANLYKIAFAQKNIYHNHLLQSENGLKYIDSRGISTESIIKWSLGMVPSNTRFPLLANRISFPIFAIGGQVCGFGFRSITNEEPKYLNSPNSPIFRKKDLWYGLHQARQSIIDEDCVILVEGYIDVILLHQYGICNSIACMSANVNNLSILKKYTKNVIVWLDGDKAGREATERYIESLVTEGFTVRIVDQKGSEKDPAELAAELGDGIGKYIEENTVFWIQYKLNKILQKLNTQLIKERLKVLPEVISILRNVKDPQELNLYALWACKYLEMDSSTLITNILREEN